MYRGAFLGFGYGILGVSIGETFWQEVLYTVAFMCIGISLLPAPDDRRGGI